MTSTTRFIFIGILACVLGMSAYAQEEENSPEPCNEFWQLTGELVDEGSTLRIPSFTVRYTDKSGNQFPFSSDYEIQFYMQADTPWERPFYVPGIVSIQHAEGYITYLLPAIPPEGFPVRAEASQTICQGYNQTPKLEQRQFVQHYPDGPPPPPPDGPPPPPPDDPKPPATEPPKEQTDPDPFSFPYNITLIILTTLILIEIARSFPIFQKSSLLLGAIFERKKEGFIGVVVSSDSGTPLAGTLVRAFDGEKSRLLKTEVTSNNGQFGFLIPAGTRVYFTAELDGFTFPTNQKPPIELAQHAELYTGGSISIREDDPEKGLRLVIPMERLAEATTSLARIKAFLGKILLFIDKISWPLMVLGFGLNTYFFLSNTDWLNTLFQILYLIIIAIKAIALLVFRRMSGAVVDTSTGAPLDLVPVRVYDDRTNRLIATRVTDTRGRYFVLLTRGRYLITATKAGYDTTRTSFRVAGKKSKSATPTIRLTKSFPTPPSL